MVLYGKHGNGKSSFAARFPNRLFVVDATEEGIHDLKASGQVASDVPVITIETWTDEMNLIDELLAEKHPYKYYVRDAIGATGLEGKLFEHVKNTECGGDWDKFLAYGRGPELAITHLNTYINKLEDLRRKGVGVLLIAHSKVKTFNDPMRESYDRIILDNHDKVQNAFLKWASTVGYIDYRVKVDDEGSKAKAKGGWFELHLNRQPAFEAKNRDGVRNPIALPDADTGFRNFAAAIKAAHEENSKTQGAA